MGADFGFFPHRDTPIVRCETPVELSMNHGSD